MPTLLLLAVPAPVLPPTLAPNNMLQLAALEIPSIHVPTLLLLAVPAPVLPPNLAPNNMFLLLLLLLALVESAARGPPLQAARKRTPSARTRPHRPPCTSSVRRWAGVL